MRRASNLILIATGLAALVAAAPARAEVRLASIFGEHMVLQRDRPIRLWGQATPGETVKVVFRGTQRSTMANAQGRWAVALPAGPAGGPHALTVQGANRLELSDVLLGDVWLCGGQSNMEWALRDAANARAELAAADHPRIRHVKVPRRAELRAIPDTVPLTWQVSTPATAGDFTAVGYHFARAVQQRTGVPIGLVNASWGGSMLETWLSPTAALADPDLAPHVSGLAADAAEHRRRRLAALETMVKAWQPGLPLADTPAAASAWATPSHDDSAWPTLQAPRPWEEQGLPGLDGQVWMRRWIELTPEQAAGPAVLHLGAVDDCDETFVNGQPVGGVCQWDQPRRYELPAGLLKPGRNLIAVRVGDQGGGGGFWGEAAKMRLELGATLPAHSLPLAGPWKARVESIFVRDGLQGNDAPTLAFNGMLAPLAGLGLKGVIWYQGESNVPRAARYEAATRRLVADWRGHFRQKQLPFYWVQLAAFLPLADNDVHKSPWAELREAQRLATAVPHTGMAVATDIGDAHDIHPRDKRSVGERLARHALRDAYRQPVPADGPTLRAVRVVPPKGDRDGHLELRFTQLAGGLAVRGGGELQGFWIAEAGGRFEPAQASVRGDTVRLSRPGLRAPAEARYGWVDNPEQANLINGAGLPASPFRTDRRPWVTQDARYGR